AVGRLSTIKGLLAEGRPEAAAAALREAASLAHGNAELHWRHGIVLAEAGAFAAAEGAFARAIAIEPRHGLAWYALVPCRPPIARAPGACATPSRRIPHPGSACC